MSTVARYGSGSCFRAVLAAIVLLMMFDAATPRPRAMIVVLATGAALASPWRANQSVEGRSAKCATGNARRGTMRRR